MFDVLKAADAANKIFKIRERHPVAAMDMETRAVYLQGMCYFSVVDNDIDPREKTFIRLLARAFSIGDEILDDMLTLQDNLKDNIIELVEIIKKQNLEIVFYVDAFFVVSADSKTMPEEAILLQSMDKWFKISEDEKRLFWSISRKLIGDGVFDVDAYLELVAYAFKLAISKGQRSYISFEHQARKLGYDPEQLMGGIIPGIKLKARVVEITDDGIVVDVRLRLDGFNHINRIMWAHLIDGAKQDLKWGQMIDVIVIDVDSDTGNVFLSMKDHLIPLKRGKGYVYYCNTGKTVLLNSAAEDRERLLSILRSKLKQETQPNESGRKNKATKSNFYK